MSMSIKELRSKISQLEAQISGTITENEDEAVALMETQEELQGELQRAIGAQRERSLKLVEGGASRTAPISGDEQFRSWLRNPEARSMTIGAASTTTLPDVIQTSVAAELVKARDAASVMRSLATVVTYPTTMKVNRLSSRNTAAWTAEAGTFNASDLDTTAVTFEAWKSTVQTNVSQELLQDSIIAVESEIAIEHGRAHGLLQEAAFVAGDASSKPNGVFTGTWDNTNTGTGTLTLAQLVDFFYTDIPTAYQPTSVWLMTAANFATIAKSVDTTGQFLMSTAMNNAAVSGAPALICGRPVYLSAYASSNKVFCGDLSIGYRIADRAGFTFQVDPYTNGSTGYVTFRSFARTDGDIVEPSAGGIHTI